VSRMPQPETTPEPFEMSAAVNRPRVTAEVNRYGEVVVEFGGTSGYFTPFEARAFAAALIGRALVAERIEQDNAELDAWERQQEARHLDAWGGRS
jgi:hypothetical protein